MMTLCNRRCHAATARPTPRDPLTFLGATAVRLGAGVRRPLGVLRQVILSRPIKDVAAVLRETANPVILKTTHMVWDVCVCVAKNKRGREKCQTADVTNYKWPFLFLFFYFTFTGEINAENIAVEQPLQSALEM